MMPGFGGCRSLPPFRPEMGRECCRWSGLTRSTTTHGGWLLTTLRTGVWKLSRQWSRSSTVEERRKDEAADNTNRQPQWLLCGGADELPAEYLQGAGESR